MGFPGVFVTLRLCAFAPLREILTQTDPQLQHRYFLTRATHNPETPKGRFVYFSTVLSAPSIAPKTPLSAGTLMLFSVSVLIPARRISCRTSRIGAKKVMLAYVERSISKPACSSTRRSSGKRYRRR
jgi:hypothetical protein